jgi:hypothetical protein
VDRARVPEDVVERLPLGGRERAGRRLFAAAALTSKEKAAAAMPAP